jgi:hypothetical protein
MCTEKNGNCETADVDCDTGRSMGCNTFCCRLLVRLDPEEREPAAGGTTQKGYVDKDPDGLCIHLDRANYRCRIWEKRPRICRAYDCNTDDLLQVAVRNGFANIVDLVKTSTRVYIPIETYVRVPSGKKP